ncbi:MAG TPA: phage tail protein [Stellaceae bacterium]|jgi:phage tail-like protein|nr:phage tail protein [Stellaceae bacterium]
MQPVSGFNFHVYFSPPAPESNALDAGDTLAAATGIASGTVNSANGVGFAEVHGINSEMEVEEYREGGRNIGARRFPKWGRYPNLVLRRGITDSTFLWDWWADVMSHSFTLATTNAPPRRNGVILLENTSHNTVAGWFFANAMPERLTGPGLNARSSEIAIETLELAHEGLLRLPASNLPATV